MKRKGISAGASAGGSKADGRSGEAARKRRAASTAATGAATMACFCPAGGSDLTETPTAGMPPTTPPGRSRSGTAVAAAGGLAPATLAGGAAALLLAALAAWALGGSRLPPETTPLKAPLMKSLPEFDESYKSEMLWGSYRSGLYFGMRTR